MTKHEKELWKEAARNLDMLDEGWKKLYKELDERFALDERTGRNK